MISLLLIWLNIMVRTPQVQRPVVEIESFEATTRATTVARDRYGQCRGCWRGSGRREILAYEPSVPQSSLGLPMVVESLDSTPSWLSWY
jgi:hypothetical protein